MRFVQKDPSAPTPSLPAFTHYESTSAHLGRREFPQDVPEGLNKLVWRMVMLGMEVGYNPPQSSYFQLFKAPNRR